MSKGIIKIYSGENNGFKGAIGDAIYSAITGEQVVIIQFAKQPELHDSAFLHKLEPEVKLFEIYRPEEENGSSAEEQKKEDRLSILNGVNFSKKVLSTGEADVVILNGFLQLTENGIISEEELKNMLESKSEETSVILTGCSYSPSIGSLADEIHRLD